MAVDGRGRPLSSGNELSSRGQGRPKFRARSWTLFYSQCYGPQRGERLGMRYVIRLPQFACGACITCPLFGLVSEMATCTAQRPWGVMNRLLYKSSLGHAAGDQRRAKIGRASQHPCEHKRQRRIVFLPAGVIQWSLTQALPASNSTGSCWPCSHSSFACTSFSTCCKM